MLSMHNLKKASKGTKLPKLWGMGKNKDMQPFTPSTTVAQGRICLHCQNIKVILNPYPDKTSSFKIVWIIISDNKVHPLKVIFIMYSVQ